MTQRAPIDGMEREGTAGRRHSTKQVPGPHTGVRCAHAIQWVNQSLGKHHYVPSMFWWGWCGQEPEVFLHEELTVKSAQDC